MSYTDQTVVKSTSALFVSFSTISRTFVDVIDLSFVHKTETTCVMARQGIITENYANSISETVWDDLSSHTVKFLKRDCSS